MSFNRAKMMRYSERVMKRLEVYQENKEMDENYELYYLLVKKGNDKSSPSVQQIPLRTVKVKYRSKSKGGYGIK